MLWKALLAAVLTAALAALGCWCRALMLLPLRSRHAVVVLPAAGDGAALEQEVRSCLLMRRWGLLRRPIVLVDRGLDAEGRRLARTLTALAEGIVLCTPRELADRLSAGD